MKKLALLLLSSLSLTSCGVTMAKYAAENDKYWVARGQIQKIENLSSKYWTGLGEGMLTEVTHGGSRVVMTCGGKTQIFTPEPGSVILVGPEDDYILLPYTKLGTPGAAPSEQDSSEGRESTDSEYEGDEEEEGDDEIPDDFDAMPDPVAPPRN
ncbi:MAG: hypothetical protein AAF517_09735 [Planctomycetota bacterium]